MSIDELMTISIEQKSKQRNEHYYDFDDLNLTKLKTLSDENVEQSP